MTIKTTDSPDVSNANLERTLSAQEATPTHAAQQPPEPPVLDDRIALSMASRLVQQSETAGESARLTRILELKTAIQKNQYGIDPLVVSHALVEAELQGR